MKRNIIALFLLLTLCVVSTGTASAEHRNKRVVLGNERMDSICTRLKGKRVALAVNHTSILETSRTHLLDTLLARRIDIRKVFAPEHGFRGTADAGATVHDSRDPKTGVPIVSVYGKNKKPSAEQLADVDVVVFDIQDVGARFFTYISTMHYLMEACAEHGKELMVLDRPNPNDYVDGPIRQPGFESFVGVQPIPVLHGLTVGELAQMINGEGWLPAAATCKLTVIKMLNWQHGDAYQPTVRPSPNLPNDQAIRLYPSLCFFEGTCMSVGRGTHFPFQIVGYTLPQTGSFTFVPTAIPGMDTAPLYKDKTCYGDDLRYYPFEGGLSLQFVIDFFTRTGRNEKVFFNRPRWFDLLAGTDALRKQILAGVPEAEIRATWQSDLDEYKQIRAKYLLYPDYPKGE
ncbi:DUF1343 domain-containing protein [Tannerella sp.]|uniref:exo-beta-N-acetylmuramidase NamZ family protein n=1 Tax=Tannerella sp. TaxID=2382127 RepID=UPI0026DD86D0|nr:DUF1343 domain-containing protein [Tannerella sp.]MDO4704469.1 DUF1343 domain-containing protein [Tannerella sp.]